jgi:hypothetical protein
MTTYLEREYRNGKAVIRVEGNYVEFVFVDHHGEVCELHCNLSDEVYQAQLSAFLAAADENDEFHPSELAGWEPGTEHFNIRFRDER